MSTAVGRANITKAQTPERVHGGWREIVIFGLLAYGLAWAWSGFWLLPYLSDLLTRSTTPTGLDRSTRRCGGLADHARPDDRRSHHAPLRQQGRVERFPRPLALLEVLPGGARCTGHLRNGGGPHRAGAGRVQVVGGGVVRLSHAHTHCAAVTGPGYPFGEPRPRLPTLALPSFYDRVEWAPFRGPRDYVLGRLGTRFLLRLK